MNGRPPAGQVPVERADGDVQPGADGQAVVGEHQHRQGQYNKRPLAEARAAMARRSRGAHQYAHLDDETRSYAPDYKLWQASEATRIEVAFSF